MHSARTGSLESPEVLENVPGHIIPILEREFDDFDTESTRFLTGELDGEDFTKFRLKQGVYGQRQPNVQMVRVKLPLGGVTPDQLDAFADGIDRYVPLRKGHITTRQNIQMHHVPLPDAAKLIRELGDAGLSSREGCGNTMRNVTGDPRAGTLEGELFDITPYAGAYVRYFVRHPTTQNMPRKFKTAFAATDEDNAITKIHDLAFLPKIRDGVRGAEVLVGGGTSIMPRLAPTLYDFVELDNGDYLKVAEAVVRIFDRTDWLRPNRARARIKVLVDKIGIDAFREMVEEELAGDWVDERDFSPDRILFEYDEEANAPARPQSFASPNGDNREFTRFVETNVQGQRQHGFSTVEVKVPLGDLTPGQFRGLANIMRAYTGGFARTSVHQNLILRWVRDESVYDVWRGLGELKLNDPGADEITDVVSCPGTDSCKLGITSSMGLNQAIHERLVQMQVDDELTRRIHVKMSGCPNGCGQHHIANIGFYGASIKVGEHTIPAYIPHVGGAYEGGDVRYGQRLKARLPAKRVPEAVQRWVRFYESERQDGEEFNAFVDRVGPQEFEAQVKDLTLPIEFSLENMNYFIDWTKSSPFEVIRGEGECAV
ncbi:MAG: nitrite/sulfite reductase [Solirubrobacterales bacterium]|nr:nitrite/sulfite reductase [Solirubrobacterales bacterium]MBV9362877.1 nitrite/sulfite reductase [Solirubrobacterales bacterium]MBV9680746.1 nitrite/sulfite reductase [Solirubrobacterales bacterium]MBV9809776.1 nitrite/sulfite reductase [Solirubrobacterales bacterium]